MLSPSRDRQTLMGGCVKTQSKHLNVVIHFYCVYFPEHDVLTDPQRNFQMDQNLRNLISKSTRHE